MSDLSIFCGKEEDCRHWLTVPLTDGENTFYTNGHIMVMESRKVDGESFPSHIGKSGPVAALKKFQHSGEAFIVTKSPDKENFLCQQCEGHGETMVECDLCWGDGCAEFTSSGKPVGKCSDCKGKGEILGECPSCYGFGVSDNRGCNPYYIGKIAVNPAYVKKIVENLGETKFYPKAPREMILFEAGEIKGALMPISMEAT